MLGLTLVMLDLGSKQSVLIDSQSHVLSTVVLERAGCWHAPRTLIVSDFSTHASCATQQYVVTSGFMSLASQAASIYKQGAGVAHLLRSSEIRCFEEFQVAENSTGTRAEFCPWLCGPRLHQEKLRSMQARVEFMFVGA